MLEKTRYTNEELKEFEQIIHQKLEKAHKDLRKLATAIAKLSMAGSNIKTNESAETEQKESLNQLVLRQQKFIQHLERALQRIKRGTYGLCVVTGKLIAKERLRLVPHTTHSVAAKQMRDQG